jgi:hypothetical protein
MKTAPVSGSRRPWDNHHPGLVLVNSQCPTGVSSPGIAGFRQPIRLTPASYNALDVRRRAGPTNSEQPSLGLGRRDARQSPDLGIRQLTMLQGGGQTRQAAECASDPDALSSRPEIKPDPPREPVSA